MREARAWALALVSSAAACTLFAPSESELAGGAAAGAGGTPAEGGAEALAGAGGERSGAGGEDAGGSAGSPGGAAGRAGASSSLDCERLGGKEFAETCYVDITTESPMQPDAVAACAEFATSSRRAGHLLVLDSEEEQEFILAEFLVQFTNESDAWLGLTCDAVTYPDFAECYCTDCDDAALDEKRALWTWIGGSRADFGWIGANPNGGGRCSALGYNPTNFSWGWVDRACETTTHQLAPEYPVHTYRAICELK